MHNFKSISVKLIALILAITWVKVNCSQSQIPSDSIIRPDSTFKISSLQWVAFNTKIYLLYEVRNDSNKTSTLKDLGYPKGLVFDFDNKKYSGKYQSLTLVEFYTLSKTGRLLERNDKYSIKGHDSITFVFALGCISKDFDNPKNSIVLISGENIKPSNIHLPSPFVDEMRKNLPTTDKKKLESAIRSKGTRPLKGTKRKKNGYSPIIDSEMKPN